MENMENLKVLQEIAKDFTILFVEDSKALRKQIAIFLEKFFKKVYIATDGVEGITQYNKYNPDLILTDLTMPILSGHDMIREIKKVNPDVDVIILSAHSDPETLMTSFHIGVADFIQKPITAPKMINVFLKVLSNIKRKRDLIHPIIINNIEKKEENNDEDILDFIFESKMKFDLINYYRGVPIINSANIVQMNSDEILVKTSSIQLLAIKHECHTILDCPEVTQIILLKVLYFDMDNYNVRLKKEKIYLPLSKHRNLSKVEPDEFFKSLLIKDELKIQIIVSSISLHEITFRVDDIRIKFSKHDIFSILLLYSHEKILIEITVSNIEEKDAYFLVSAYIKYVPKNEELLMKYIANREKELLEEFKNLFLY